MQNVSRLFSIGLFFCTAITVHAEVYKTTNSDGTVSYSDSPSQNSTKINGLPSAAGGASKQTTKPTTSPAGSANAGETNLPSANDVKPVTTPQPARTTGGNQSKAASTSGSSSSGAGGSASTQGGGGGSSSSGATGKAATTTVAPKATTGNTTTGNTTTGNTTTGNTTTDNTANQQTSLLKILTALSILKKDMATENEAMPAASDQYAWAYKPTMVMGANPTASGIPKWYPGKRFAVWDRVLGWITVYREKGAPAPVNTRVAFKDLSLYYFSKAQKKWILLESLPNIKEDYRGEANTEGTNIRVPYDVRLEKDGFKSYKFPAGSWFHTYGYMHSFDISDFGGLYYRFDFKLVLDNPAGPNTLNTDKLVVQAGADYYPVEYPKESLGASYNPGVGTGRFLRAGPQWRTATFTLMTPDYKVDENPPNVDNFYE